MGDHYDWECIVCRERGVRYSTEMCEPCNRSYDRYAHDTGAIWDVIVWAADRARRFERRRARGAQ